MADYKLNYTGKEVNDSIELVRDSSKGNKALKTALDTEIIRAEAAESDINSKIPTQASSTNQLADKDFVNSSIATATATFRGTVDTVAKLKALTGDLNDYAFLKITDTTTGLVKQYDKYKYSSASSSMTGYWVFEYTLNNSSFTEDQWKAITSGVTDELVAQITANKNSISTEITNRTNADKILQTNIDNEVKARASADETLTTNLTSHTSNTSNPHSVTKAQIGLGNVDNTSDLSKPISTATQTALDKKANASDLTSEVTRAKAREDEIEDKMYETVAPGTSIATMGQLRSFINEVNSSGRHVFFDLHTYVSNAYVCTASMFSANSKNYCLIFDVIGKKAYMDYAGYSDTTLISTYLSANSNDLVSTITLTDVDITLKEVKTKLDEVNSLGHHVLFDTYSLGQAGFYLTTISFTDNDSKLTVFDLVGAKLNTVAYKEDMTLVEVMQGASKVITEENAKVLTDLISQISYRVAKLEGSTESVEWATIQAEVVQGFGPEKYPTYDKDKGEAGTQIQVDWHHQASDGGTISDYTTPFNVVLHSEKASTSPIAILDDAWSIDSYHTTNITDESKFDTDMGTENTHANNLMYLESEYTLPFGTQFDAPEALLVVAEGKTLPAGTYNVKWHCSDGTSNDIYLQFTLSSDVASGHQLRLQNVWWGAAMIGNTLKEYENGKSTTVIQTSSALAQGQEGTYLGYVWSASTYGTDGAMNDYLAYDEVDGVKHYLNHGDRIKCGYNRWSQSGLRQYLNAEGFNWWKPMNTFDVAPSYQAYRGFMSGLSDSLRAVIKPVRRWQERNYTCDSGSYEYTYDKVFLHVPYERYCQTENNGSKEGSTQRWANYKSLLDTWNDTHSTSLTQFGLRQIYDVLKKGSMANATSYQYYWSSSARRSFGCSVWSVHSSGYVNYGYACNGDWCCPAFVVSK